MTNRMMLGAVAVLALAAGIWLLRATPSRPPSRAAERLVMGEGR